MPIAVLKGEAVKGAWERARHSAMFYGTLATAVRVGANILLLPLVLKVLAPPELAVWYVFLALGGIANLADFGFGAAFSRVYSFLWAGAEDFQTEGLAAPARNQSPNLPSIRRFHSAVRTAYIRIALIATALLMFAGTAALIRPIESVTNPIMGWICWGTFVISIAYSLGSSSWALACQGINRMRNLQAANFVSGLGYVLIAALLLLFGWGLFAMVAATAVRAIITRQMCRTAYLAAVPNQPDGNNVNVTSTLKRIWPNAWKFGMVSLGGYLTLQANVLICSHFLGSEMTASYGLTTQVANFMMSFSALWLVVKWPEITMLRTQGRLREMAILFARRLTFVMLSLAAMALLLLMCGNMILEWNGTQTKFLPTFYLSVYLVNLFQQQFYAQFGMLTFTENVVPFFKLGMFTGLAVVGLSLLLTPRWGLGGLVAAPLIVTASTCCWYVTLRGFQGQPLSVRQFARAAVFGHL